MDYWIVLDREKGERHRARQLTKNGNLQICEMKLVSPIGDGGFVIRILSGKRGEKRQTYAAYQLREPVNLPVYVYFSMDNNGQLKLDIEGAPSSIDMANAGMEGKIEALPTDITAVFLFDATMSLNKTIDNTGRETVSGRFPNGIKLMVSLSKHLRNHNSQQRLNDDEYEDEIQETVSFGLILFGEYNLDMHPINSFDSERHQYDVAGGPQILDFEKKPIKGYRNDFLDANAFDRALVLLHKFMDRFYVDGGDFEDCLEYGFIKAEELFKGVNDGIKLLFIITDSPPHPHTTNEEYTSRQYYIYRSDYDWRIQADALEKARVASFVFMSDPEAGFASFSQDEQDTMLRIWRNLGYTGCFNMGIKMEQELDEAIRKAIADAIDERQPREVRDGLVYPVAVE